MKFIWEEKDIKGGQRYASYDSEEAEVWIIGAITAFKSDDSKQESPKEKRWVSVSLSDGLVTGNNTKSDMAESLNKEGCIPIEWINRERK